MIETVLNLTTTTTKNDRTFNITGLRHDIILYTESYMFLKSSIKFVAAMIASTCKTFCIDGISRLKKDMRVYSL